ncbi:MAG: gliding motility-associated-like protein [Polaribacter sp.]|jgi:gliding motility-associated-like protein
MNLLNSLSLFLIACLLCCFSATANATVSDCTDPTPIPTILPQTLTGGFSLTAGSASAAPGQLYCVAVTCTGFDSLVAIQFSMVWDTAVIQYAYHNVLLGMPDPVNFGANALPSGQMPISWNASQISDPANGIYPWESVPDGTELYEVCFTVVGEVGESSPFSFEGAPINIEVISANSDGMDIGICNPINGMITVIEAIELANETISNINCASVDQGSIDIDYTGGTPPYEYLWDGPNMFFADTEDISNLEEGIYYVTMTDNSLVSQIILDTFEVAGNFAVAIADAGVDTVLNCYNNALIELDGSIDPDDSDSFYEWYTNDGNFVTSPLTLSPDIDQAGTYYLVATNIFSNCADTAEVVVLDNSSLPAADAGMNDELNCFQSMINLNGTNSAQGDNVEYSWTTLDGNILNGDNTQTPLIDMPGVYELVIFDGETGCSNSSTVNIIQDSALPMAVAGEDTTLTCLVMQITLDGTDSSSGSDFSYNWTTDDGGDILNPTTLMPTITDPGTYFLIVTDDVNTCSDTSIVVVSESELPPSVDAGDELTLSCDLFAAQLDGTNTVQGTNYEYLWTTTNGNIFDEETTLTPTVDDCGVYTLQVTNTADGCTSIATVEVFCDTLTPDVNFGPAPIITCIETEVGIDGSASSTGPDYIYTWNSALGNIVSGNGTTAITVDVSANYGLLIQDTTNGCIALSSIFVVANTAPPIAEAGDPVTIECGDPVPLNGTGTTIGDTISYFWTTSNGNILMDGNEGTLMPIVDVGGEYYIFVTNNVNGCTAEDFVLIDGGIALETSAPELSDATICGTELLITANLPLASSGVWTSNNPVDFFENPMTDTTMVFDLEPGLHAFTWTLSTVECPDYDSESIEVYVEGMPDAIEDEFDLSGYITDHVIDVLENDDTSAVSGWTLELVNTPDAGLLSDAGTGLLDFSFLEGYFGSTSFDYALCNENCPDQCDTTAVILNISEPLDTITTIPNGITPNGDGLNDEFIIPEIKLNPELYPDNEFIVFNRWGDIVYQAKPYNNDWTGTATGGGKDLPAGTYYFVIRLDIGKGEGYKGDVTILR